MTSPPEFIYLGPSLSSFSSSHIHQPIVACQMPVTFAPSSPPRTHRRLSPSSPGQGGQMMTSLRPTHHILPPSRRSRTRASFSSDRSDRSDPPSPPDDPGALLAAVHTQDASHSPQETSMHSSSRAWVDPERLPLLAEANESIEEPRSSRRLWRIVGATSLTVLIVAGILLWTANLIWPWHPRSSSWASS